VLALVLLFTGFPLFFGWVIGLGLLVSSPLWTVRQKLLAVLVWPGGLMATIGAGLLTPTSHTVCVTQTRIPRQGAVSTLGSVARTCTSSGARPSWAAAAVGLAFLVHVAVVVHLYRAAGRNAVNA